jgi:glycosyltransferase involved in cell wall biosynthesis
MKSIIVIPCFNERQRLSVNTFCKFLSKQNCIQFVFVDDGSSDYTFQILKEINNNYPKNTYLLQFPENKGKAEAVRQGL